MEVISTFSLISINATLVAQLISFLIFVFLINRIMFRPLQSTMRQRDAQVEAIKQEISAIQAEMDTIFEKLAADEFEAKDSALAVQYQLEIDGKQKASDIFNAVRIDIEQLKDKTRQSVEQQILEVRKKLAQESQQLVKIIINKVLDRRLAHE